MAEEPEWMKKLIHKGAEALKKAQEFGHKIGQEARKEFQKVKAFEQKIEQNIKAEMSEKPTKMPSEVATPALLPQETKPQIYTTPEQIIPTTYFPEPQTFSVPQQAIMPTPEPQTTAIPPYPTIKTDGGWLVTVPEHSKVYLVEGMPLNPFERSVVDISATAQKQMVSQKRLSDLI